MGLTSALQIGRTALNYAQAALQVTGNNMANATTPGFTRQTAIGAPLPGDRLGRFGSTGGGVLLSTIQRHVDEAINARIRGAIGREQSALTRQNLFSQIESIQSELTDSDLSSALTRFFNAWSELANNPGDLSVRTLVVQEGVSLAGRLQDTRRDYVDVRNQIDRDAALQVNRADELLTQIAAMNLSIVQAEQGQGTASSLRDERDQLIDELAGFMDISVVEQPAGTVDIFVGSTPLLLGSTSRGLTLRTVTTSTGSETVVETREDGADLELTSGSLGALMSARTDIVEGVIDDLDSLASTLIFEVNRIHSQGQGSRGFESVEGTYRVDDPAAALNSTAAGLPFTIVNGSLQIHLTQESTGERTSFQIDVDLDGVGSDMSLNDLVNAINTTIGAGNITAAATADGRLSLTAADGYTLSFSDDTSGVLAGLGVNTFFTGESALDIAVNDVVLNDATYVAAGSDHIDGSNGTALEIAGLSTRALDSLGGLSLPQSWTASVESLAIRGRAAIGETASAQLVKESLQAQRAAVSGVSLDEEAVNLLNYQRQYEAAARYISVVDELMQTLMTII
ncbi:MAG: flagellar hook-associated protein FlgK [Phycisphaerales bacterium]|nr:flagellar hook-associated protein FlgK [Phycisphaerales bacterium]